MNERDGVEFSGRELCIDVFVIDVFSPLDLEWLGVFATALGDIEPFVGERTAHATETPRSTRLRMEASITPQAEEVERKTGCLVPKSVCSFG